MSNAPFFVLGSPRSGTSWLARVLDAHPRLFCGLELDLLGAFSKVARIRAVHGDESRLRGGPVVLRDGALTLASKHVRDVALYELERSGKPRFGDKTPVYATQMTLLDQLFPDGQVIHIIRDGRDVACSILHNAATLHHWRTEDWVPRTIEGAAAYWWQHVSAAQRSGAALSADRYYEVRYEDLMADPLGAGAGLFAFLQEELAPEVVARLRTAKPRSLTWSAGLSPRELRRFEAVPGIAQGLVSLGYPLRAVAEPPAEVAVEAITTAEAAFAGGRLDEALAVLNAAADAGVDEREQWALMARVEQALGRHEVAANLRVRALRGFALDPMLCEELLSQADLAQSVVAAEVAIRHGATGPLRGAVLRWLVARGLDVAAAGSFLSGLKAPPKPPPAGHALAPVLRAQAAIRLGETSDLSGLVPDLRAALADPSTAAASRLTLAELALLREDPQLVLLLREAVAAGSLEGALRALALSRTQTSAAVVPIALSRVELPRVRDAAKGWLEGRGLDADAANAVMHVLWADAQESVLR